MSERIPVTRPWLPDKEEYLGLVRDILDRHWLSNFAKYAELLEERAGEVLGDPHAMVLSSCDVGLMLSWRALEVPPGEVLVPSYTFASTVNSLRWNDLTPVFVDIDPGTLCMDPNHAKQLITDRTVAICAVHTFGRPAAVDELEALASEHGLKLVFDAAHAVGGSYKGRHMGQLGDLSAFSLSGTKLVTAGEGGVVTMRDEAVRDRMRRLRNYGFLYDYDVKEVGMNGKISEMNAALGWLSIGRLAEAILHRHALVAAYIADLSEIGGIGFQDPAPDHDIHTYKDFAVLFESGEARARVKSALDAANIETKRYFLPVHHMEAYKEWRDSPLPVTDAVYDTVLCLPVFHDLAESDRQRVVETVARAMQG